MMSWVIIAAILAFVSGYYKGRLDADNDWLDLLDSTKQGKDYE